MIKLKFRDQLKKIGKNASEVASETKINRNTVNALVNDKIEGIRFSTLDKLCQTYNLNLTDILEYEAPGENIAQRKLYKQEAEMVPFTIWLGMIALSKINISLGEKIQDLGQMEGYFRKNYTIAYWDDEAMDRFAEIFYALYAKPDQIDGYFSEYQIIASEIESLYDSLWDLNISEVKEGFFRETLEAVKRAYISFWLKSFFIEAFDAGFDQKKLKEIAENYRFSKKEIEVLTSPPELTLDQAQKLAFLRLLVKVSQSKEPLKALIKHQGDVEAYKRQFDFSQSNYAVINHITDGEIESQAKELLKNKRVLKKELERLSEYPENLKNAIAKVLRRHHLKKNPLYFFNKLTAFREHRKTVNMMGFHVLDFLLSYLELKTGIPKKYLKFLAFEEIESVLKGLVSQETLKSRYEKGMLVSIFKDELKTFEGKEAHSIAEDLERQYQEKEVKNLLRGFTGSQGYAKGPAKLVLSDKDFNNFKPGDVLVTSAVRGEYAPLVEKASAVVTGEGGVSSYSAAISRSLGKPCVIGVGNAFSVIKDNDLLEVRASHGTVRIVSE